MNNGGEKNENKMRRHGVRLFVKATGSAMIDWGIAGQDW